MFYYIYAILLMGNHWKLKIEIYITTEIIIPNDILLQKIVIQNTIQIDICYEIHFLRANHSKSKALTQL